MNSSRSVVSRSFLQPGRSYELRSVRERPGGVDRVACVFGSPLARRRRNSPWRSPTDPCARGSLRRPSWRGAAPWPRASSAAGRPRSRAASNPELRRRRGRRGAQQVLQNPFAALHHGRPVGIRGHRQNAALPQQPAAVRIGQRHTAELRSVNIRVCRSAPPAAGSGRCNSHPAVPSRDGLRAARSGRTARSLRRKPSRRALVEFGEDFGVGFGHCQVAQVEPLPGEVIHQRVRFGGRPTCAALRRIAPRVRAACLFRPVRASARRECCSTGRRRAARPARNRSAGKPCRARPPAGSRSMRNRKSGRNQHGAQRLLDAVIEIAFAAARLVEGHQRPDVGIGYGPRNARRANAERMMRRTVPRPPRRRDGRRRCGRGWAFRRARSR